MKKSVKKALIATFATVFVGAAVTTVASATANSVAANAADGAAVTDFVMLADPTIRATNAADGSGNGIRFTAEIDKTQFEALDGTVTAGTFIMPYTYVSTYAKDTTLTKGNFFGENACFVWGEGATASATKAKILHVAATPYAATSDSGEAVYKINGSVVNMLKKNLEREYIGVSYIAVENGGTTEYYLANTDAELASKSTLQVAQDVLLGESEAIEDSVATGYLQTYIDWYKGENSGNAPTRTLTTEYYIDSSEGYSKSKKFGSTQEIAMDEVADFTTAQIGEETPTLEGYTYAVGANGNVTSAVLSADNGGTVKYYFDKNRNNVIFDGATMSMKEIAASGDHTTVEADVVLKTFAGCDASTGNPGIVIGTGWGYHGAQSIKMRSPGGGGDWANAYFHNPITFPATNKLSFVIRSEYNSANDVNIEAYIYDQANAYHAISIPRKAAEGEINYVTVELDAAITSVTRLEIFTGATPGFFIDYICAENELTSSLGNLEVAKGQTTVDVDVAGGIASTVYSDEELATAQITATYKALPAGTAQSLTLTDGKATLTVAEESDYQVDYTVVINGKTVNSSLYVLGYYENVVFDFEENGTCSAGISLVDSGINGKALQINAAGWHLYDSTDVTLTKACTTVSLWVFAPKACSVTDLTTTGWLYVSNGHWYAGEATIAFEAGWNYVQYELTNAASVCAKDQTITNFQPHGKAASLGIIVDRIALK